MFVAAWSARFVSAIESPAFPKSMTLPASSEIDAMFHMMIESSAFLRVCGDVIGSCQYHVMIDSHERCNDCTAQYQMGVMLEKLH